MNNENNQVNVPSNIAAPNAPIQNVQVETPDFPETMGAGESPKKIKKIANNPVNVTKKVFVYIFLTLFALWILVPFFIVLVTSIKFQSEIDRPRFTWIPTQGLDFSGYAAAFKPVKGTENMTLIKGFFNTLWIIIPPTLIGLTTSALAAYAYAKLKFRGKNILFAIMLATMMIPGMVTFVPSYVLFNNIGWGNGPLPLMIPGMFGAAACVFYLRQFFMGIPSETLEAARLDGVGYFGMFFQMMLPLAVPALIAQGILGFVGGYNDYLGPMLYVSDHHQTLQVMLGLINGMNPDKQNVQMASTVIALVPTIIIYLVAQKYFIEGIAVSGLK